MGNWAMALHGGAYSNPEGGADTQKLFLRELLPLIAQKLKNNESALEVVTETVVAMENCGLFNAGKGAVANKDGDVELDAAVMEGHTARAGGVAAIRNFRNPILGARAVMEQTNHVLLAGEKAEVFLRAQGLEEVPAYYFSHARMREHGTIGAVALDKRGHLAVATSTGGISGKLPGRVGDSPLIGAGTYADTHVAVSCTGMGEYFIRTVAAAQVAMLVEHRLLTLAEAAQAVLERVEALGGRGGLIAIDKQGHVTAPFTTRGMVHGWALPGELEVHT